MSEADLALSVALGIGLAAATGFRLFVPLLVMSLAANSGFLPLSTGFEWLGTTSAVAMLAIAALAEILAFYVPAVDNLLDTIATPAAIVAGIVVSAAVMTDMPPMLKWTLAIIAGGGAAALTQGTTAAIRAHSTVLTAGFGNPFIATAELGGSLILSLLAIAFPVIAVAVVALFCWAAYRLVRRARA